MPKSKKRKKSDDDEDWFPEGKKRNKRNKKSDKHTRESCFIHCTDSDEMLTKLPSLESWKKLLEAARTRGDEKVIKLEPSSSTSKDYPVIYYHLRCRNVYTHKKTLNTTASKVS